MIAAETTFDADAHVYRGPRGRLPGATDVIKTEGLIDAQWMSEDCRWRGKIVHHGIKLINKGTLDEDTVAEEIRGYLDSYRLFLKITGFEVVGYEEPLFDSAFGCIPDLWGGFPGGANSIVELKTGPVPKWAKIQTALQARALWEHKRFRAFNRYGLRLMADGRLANLIPFEDPKDDYTAMGMVQSFHWKLDNGYIPDWRAHGQ